MATISGLLILGLATILQISVVSRVTLLQGPADIVLLALLAWILREGVEGVWQWGLIAGLLVGFSSALPFWIPLAAYLLVTSLVHLLQTRVWRIPLLLLLSATVLGTFLIHGVSLTYILVTGASLDPFQAFNLIILPSVFLNLILALPIYGFMSGLSNWLYPSEAEA